MDSKRRTTVVLLSLSVIGVVSLAALPNIRVSYHLWRMQQCHRACQKAMLDADFRDRQAAWASYRYHLDALVEAGYLFHAAYRDPRFASVEAGLTILEGSLHVARPGNDGIPCVSTDEEADVEVWDLVENRREWDAIMVACDEVGLSGDEDNLLQAIRNPPTAFAPHRVPAWRPSDAEPTTELLWVIPL